VKIILANPKSTLALNKQDSYLLNYKNMNTTDLELTPAELEMINLKREQEALAKKEVEAKKALQLEKDIKDKQAYIAKIKAVDQAQVDATKAYLAEIKDSQYSLEITTRNETVQIMGDYINRDNGFDRHILWAEEVKRQSAKILHDAGYKIQVDEQVVYANRWSSRSTSKGYKMYVSGPGIDWKEERRALARVAKAKEKIETAIEKIKAEEDYKNKQKGALQTTVDKFQAEYPDAEVTTDRGYERGYGKRYSDGVTYDMVRVKFVNGAAIAYRVYADGSLSRVSFNLPGSKDEATFMKNLSQIKF